MNIKINDQPATLEEVRIIKRALNEAIIDGQRRARDLCEDFASSLRKEVAEYQTMLDRIG